MKVISRLLQLKSLFGCNKSECKLETLTIPFSSNTRLGHYNYLDRQYL